VRLATTRAALAAALGGPERPRAAVLTMGALHDGHVRLVGAAREAVGPQGVVVVTVFVNPLQFAAGEDLARYPRDLEADVAVAAEAGADVVFAPPVEVLYPDGDPAVTVDPGPLGEELEGAARPGHFRGVLTVVTKLLRLVDPQVTPFGEKDYQQLVLVRRLCRDLDLGVDVLAVPTDREPDGLARSSRNRYLSPDERARAAVIPEALAAAVAAAPAGPDAVLGTASDRLARAGLVPDYVALRSPELGPAPTLGEARLLVAARVGATRLLDNVPVLLGDAVQAAHAIA
jgi:pantoate--beta-alanine ligase